MKRILCFGDSNTWGYIPGAPALHRFAEDVRWTGRLQCILGADYAVLEFGLCGCESGAKGKSMCYNANAQSLYPSVLFASLPVDIAIIMLGTNDLKTVNHWVPGETAAQLKKLVQVTRTISPTTCILLAAPVVLQPGIEHDSEYDSSAIAHSILCAQEVKELAITENLLFFDTNAHVQQLGSDGCHFTAHSHARFATALAECIQHDFSFATLA